MQTVNGISANGCSACLRPGDVLPAFCEKLDPERWAQFVARQTSLKVWRRNLSLRVYCSVKKNKRIDADDEFSLFSRMPKENGPEKSFLHDLIRQESSNNGSLRFL